MDLKNSCELVFDGEKGLLKAERGEMTIDYFKIASSLRCSQ